jgi:branched-chain amino acid transport system substrate-binding protein
MEHEYSVPDCGKTSVDAARMAVEDVSGKVLGRSIEKVIGDHQKKPDMASALVRRWFDVDGVNAVAAKEQGRRDRSP